MDKPCLVVMAAGMGSRFGGLKQMAPVDNEGHIIMDFSVYDAHQAGFDTVIFIIKHDFEEAFKNTVSERVSRYMNVKYAFQQLDDLPAGYSVPEGRVKPWGTAHALLSARELINGPFAVINADDYYGKQAFIDQYRFLSALSEDEPYHYAMSGYHVINTLTENGYVARGVCAADIDGYLTEITERTKVGFDEGQAAYSEDDGASWVHLAGDTPVSMNLWGFGREYITEAWERFPAFLDRALRENPLKGEYYLPSVDDALLKERGARIKVITTPDRWYGVTYAEDKPTVVAAIARMKADGLYPDNF